LAESGSISNAQLEQSELETRTLAATLSSTEFGAKVADYELLLAESAKGRLTKGKSEDEFAVSSPVDGQVLRVLHESEGPVQPGTALIELGDPRGLEVAVDILSSDAVRIAPGAKVTLERWGGIPLSGVVRLIEPSAFTRVSALGVEEQRVNAIIALTSPPADFTRLGDGYRVEAKIAVWSAPNVLKVPTSATFRQGAGWAVYTAVQHRVRRVTVELGASDGLFAEVTNGLKEHDIVVTHPSDRVSEGVEIAPQ
jgi:HlyD family secretion protein